MEEQIIKIDRNSIKKNPDAGRTSYQILNSTEIRFEWKGINIPKILKHKDLVGSRDGVHVITYNILNESEIELEGYIDHESLISLIPQGQGKLKLITSYNYVNVSSITPEPEYFYKYEDTLVKCSECHSEVNVKHINTEIDDYGNEIKECPVCKRIETFNYKYERFNKTKLFTD